MITFIFCPFCVTFVIFFFSPTYPNITLRLFSFIDAPEQKASYCWCCTFKRNAFFCVPFSICSQMRRRMVWAVFSIRLNNFQCERNDKIASVLYQFQNEENVLPLFFHTNFSTFGFHWTHFKMARLMLLKTLNSITISVLCHFILCSFETMLQVRSNWKRRPETRGMRR